jgi:hypothetical protein
MTAPYEITAVEHLGGHRLRLTFADGFVIGQSGGCQARQSIQRPWG